MDTSKIHHVSKNDINNWNDKATIKDLGEYLSSEAGAITTDKIAEGAITGDKIANGTITQTRMANNSVGTNQLINLNVTTDKIANNAVTTAKVNDLSITNAKIANATITGSKLVNATITQSQLANNSVGTNQINNLAVTGAKIANGTITADKIATNASLGGGIKSVQRGIVSNLDFNSNFLDVRISAVNLSKSFVITSSYSTISHTSNSQVGMASRLSSSTNLVIQRGTGSGASFISVNWEVVEFN